MTGNPVYRFDGYRVEPAKRELWHEGELVPLQPKAFDCLVYLLEHRDRVVGRDELIATVWGKVDIADSVLGQIISRIRGVLGDNAAKQVTIRTITRVGYSWVMPVHVVNAEPDAPAETPKTGHQASRSGEDTPSEPPAGNLASPATPTGDPPAAPASRQAAAWVLTVAALVLIAALVIHVSLNRQSPAAHGGQSTDTAVILPVKVSHEPGNAWIRLGIMDLIGERLRAAGQTVVPSDNVVALARDLPSEASDAQIAELARATSANLILRSSAETIGNGWRVEIATVHRQGRTLIVHGDGADVIEAARIASDRMAILLDLDIVPPDGVASRDAARDYLLQQVKAAILADRLAEARALLEKSGPADHPNVLYQLGQVELRAGNYVTSQRIFENLLEEVHGEQEPILRAQILHGLAFARIRQLQYGQARAPVDEAIALLEAHPSLTSAHGALGFALSARALLRRVDQDFEGAEADYIRARVLFESSGDQLALGRLDANLSMLLQVVGRGAEANALAQKAQSQLQLFGDVQSELRLRTTLAELYRSNLELPQALDQTREFERLIAQIDNPELEEYVNLIKVDILADSGLISEAHELVQQLLDNAAGQSRDVTKGIWPEYVAAWLSHDTGDAQRAAQFAQAALDEQAEKPTSSPTNIARTWMVLYRGRLALDGAASAERTYQAALDWARAPHVQDAGVDHWLSLMRAERAAGRGDAEAAKQLYDEAWTRATSNAVPLEILDVAASYCDFLFANGRAEEATLIAGRTARWSQTSYAAALLQTRLHHALGQTSAWRRALDRSLRLAGERHVPASLLNPPQDLANAIGGY